MILYGVTVYNAILIISYHIITYKLIYITVPEEYPGGYSMGWPQAQGFPASLELKKPRSDPAAELLGQDSGRGIWSTYSLKTPRDLTLEGRDRGGRDIRVVIKPGRAQHRDRTDLWPQGSRHQWDTTSPSFAEQISAPCGNPQQVPGDPGGDQGRSGQGTAAGTGLCDLPALVL